MNASIDKLVSRAIKNGTITRQDYTKHDVRQGLRNLDGSGVKVILTRIADVEGYERQDGKLVPIDGKLIYRGYEIKDLVRGFLEEGRFGFEETTYLLMAGELPAQDELRTFSQVLADARNLPHEFVQHIILPFPGPNIMNKLMTSVTVLYRLDENPDNISVENVARQSINLIAKFPTIIAYSWMAKRFKEGTSSLYIHAPNGSLSTAESFLSMMREDREFTPLEARILDLMLVLHAEHGGGNNSTFTTHTVASTDSDTYSVIAAALASLKGHKHGGANAEVLNMVDAIEKEVKPPYKENDVLGCLIKVLKGEIGDGSGLIYGMGHPVYKITDPRALIIKEEARKLAQQAGREEEFELYLTIERLTPEAMRAVKGKYTPTATNVDFFSGFVYDCMGLPREIYTPLFAMARIAGWSAHLLEHRVNRRDDKIIRPAAEYEGIAERSYVPLAERIVV